ncbi:MAG: hypothetical protein C0501_08625 [Isosphaera sp.]|nr:hypothetical protein [Isosphaera sp.]
MTADERALLAAVVADPADDTVRLAYADCIEEGGNAARAEFIRVQIEAERLHPDSNARAALEERAGALFAEHWVDWWGEVCAAVGLRPPAPKPAGRLGKVAGWFGVRRAPGQPYATTETFDGVRTGVWQNMREHREVVRFPFVGFRRGFPESLSYDRPAEPGPDPVLACWLGTNPLTFLHTVASYFGGPGPYPVGLRTLSVSRAGSGELRLALDHPSLDRLDELRLPSAGPWELSAALGSPRVCRLRRLAVPVRSDHAAAAVAAADLARLEALDVELHADADPGGGRPGVLARSPRLAGLRELRVVVPSGVDSFAEWVRTPDPPDVFRPLTTGPAWAGLRKLTVEADLHADQLAGLLGGATLPDLDELRLVSVFLSREVIDLFVRSPLLKQLRHLAISAWGVDGVSRADLRRLPQMLDLDRIETFAFAPDHDMPGLDELARQLGDRLRHGVRR